MAYVPLAGKYGRIMVNGRVQRLSEHELRPVGDDIDTTHFESEQSVIGSQVLVWGEGLVGVSSADLMIRGMFDAGQNPHGAPIYLFPGLYGTAFAGLTKVMGYNLNFRVLETPVSVGVRKGTSFEGRLKSNGIVAPPTASV